MKAYLEPEDEDKLEQAADNVRDQLMIRMLRVMGARVSEALSISVEDVDVEKGTVTIQHLKTKLNLACPRCSSRLGRKHSFCPGCGRNVTEAVRKEVEHRRVRTLPIDAGTLSMIRDFIDRGGPVLKNGRLLLFPINRHRAWQIIRGCAGKAGLSDLVNPDTGKVRGVSPHRLRDAFAIHAMKFDDSGDGLRLLQEHLGHASFNTTARYRKVAGEEHRAWYNKLWAKKDSPDA